MKEAAKELLLESRHDFDSLVRVMELLRAPGGCPWDREQTHESIRANFIEETYEVIEAIDNADSALLREELGDVLLQVVFHARISEEAGDFSIGDVINEVTEKLIRRHPHIFADVEAKTTEKVLANWEQIKTEEKQRVGLAGSLNAVPPSLPALMRAQKLMKKAAKEDICPDTEQLAKELTRAAEILAEALRAGDKTDAGAVAGRLAFLTAAAGQLLGADTEEMLSRESTRFTAVLTEAEAKMNNLSDTNEQKTAILAQNAYFLH